ncbi:cytochrome-c oxidase, cbb3-type subunit III [Erythrobacter sp. THAF29]|uniref:cytochrome-c oxidase, cbb3-type subunit III n=1 Tax=Erythrobacter sp. THAF29 TaxID=2587851 RepID=UPI001268587E|nr:cytochrome-c oxidase, cbb3-type subunit III [Erythrobacter sp. THAF29]QFT76469.1 Cbb3-type cytochrome c oxidase subunit CcoP [Erythrobacter sp. THAF29]
MSDKSRENARIDEPTGTELVGHEWDGIEELNTPLPRWWLWTFYATIAWSLVYVVLYPAWPLVERATEGVLGWSSRGELAEEMSAADLARRSVYEQIAATDITKLPANPELMGQAIAGGAAAFKQHCVQCHGAGAAGYEQYGYPNLNDDDWIWGGELAEIEYTLTHGIRWGGSRQTRQAYMPPFEGALEKPQVDALVNHVLSLSGKGQSSTEGVQLFAQNCAACHQPDGSGDQLQGAPALNDAIWLYGGEAANIRAQILNPRHGVMPGWSDKLDPVTIKMLAAYVHSRGGGESAEEGTEEVASDAEAVAEAPEGGDDERL